jgi:hypothetical protein
MMIKDNEHKNRPLTLSEAELSDFLYWLDINSLVEKRSVISALPRARAPLGGHYLWCHTSGEIWLPLPSRSSQLLLIFDRHNGPRVRGHISSAC